MELLKVGEYGDYFGNLYISLEQELDCIDGTKAKVWFCCVVRGKELSLFKVHIHDESGNDDYKVIENLIIPDVYDDYTITSIVAPFGLFNVRREESEKRIARAANLVIPDTITFIEQGSFKDSCIARVTWSKGCDTIPDYCFQNCKVLKEIKGIGHITKIGKYAFEDTNIQEITIPDTCKSVSEFCFRGCYALKSVTWSKNCDTIPACCFGNCQELKSIKNISHIIKIEQEAFCNTGFTGFDWPENCGIISRKCFFYSEKLKTIKITTPVVEIDYCAFGCTVIKKLDLSQCVYAYLEKDSIPEDTEVILPFYASTLEE